MKRYLTYGLIRIAAVALLAVAASGLLSPTPTASANNTDYDADNDNLIEVSTHAQLNAIRWDTDGDGSAANAGYALAFPSPLTGMGCAATCAGYELKNDIDLDTDGDGTADSGDAYWNNGAGWSPMGLNTTFEGNGYAIQNLYINLTHPSDQSNRNYYVGFFGHVQTGAKIEDVGFEDVNIRSSASSIWSSTALWMGGIAGYLQGATITDSYVTGTIHGSRTNTNNTATAAVGGLVGLGRGDVVASYADVTVTAYGRGKGSNGVTAEAGGIVGRTYGDVIASYTAGSVIADGDAYSEAGGLIGRTLANGSEIVASYSKAQVEAKTATARAGGLVGHFSHGTIDSSYFVGKLVAPSGQTRHPINAHGTGTGTAISKTYWDSDVTGVPDDANATAPEGRTTAQLQAPTSAVGIYGTWNVDLDNADNDNDVTTGGDDPWDFGTSSQYPVLDYGEHSVTPQREVDYDADNDNLIDITTAAQLNAIRWDTDGNGSASSGNTTNYTAAFPDAKTGMGCGGTCAGYELGADVDLDTNGNGRADSGDAYWNSGSGWNPIGSFSTTLKGNGHAIKGLYVNRTTGKDHGDWEIGFFTSLSASTLIDGIVFHDVDVYGGSTHWFQAAAQPWVGAVAGKLASGGTISNVTVTGSVRAYLQSTNANYQAHAGGVVGMNSGTIDRAFSGAYVEATVGNYRHAHAGGIAGDNPGTIIASWFTGHAHARGASGQESRAGGIAGYMTWSAGSVKASYSTGKVEASTGTSRRGGGIVGYLNNGTVQASWAAGTVIATTQRGGITGNPSGGTVTDSYYDSTVITGSLNGQGTAKTTSELQTPTAYGTGTSIYKDWNLNLDGTTGNDDPWDFGTSSQYPVIKYKSTPTTGQRSALGQVTGLTATANSAGTGIDLAWTAVTGAEGYVARWKSGSEAYSAVRQITNASQSTVTASITGLTAGTAYSIEVYAYKVGAKHGAAATASVTPTTDLDSDDDNLIEVKTIAQLNAIRYDLDGNGTPSGTSTEQAAYRTAFGTGSNNVTCHGTCIGYELRASLDFDTDGDGTVDSDDAWWNSGAGFVPIGPGAFTAEFDGNSDKDVSGDGGPYQIANLLIDATTTTTTAGDYYAGLFANLGSAAEVTNLALVDVDVTHTTSSDGVHVWAGALAGQSAATISGVSVTGDVATLINNIGDATQNSYAGGIVGKMTGGSIRSSSVDAAVKAENQDLDTRSNAYAGGIASQMTGGTIEAVYTLGSVDADMRAITPIGSFPRGHSWAAGITAKIASGTIRAVYSRAAVTAHANNGGGQSTNRAYRAEVIAAGLVVRADSGTEVSRSYAANTPRATKGESVTSATSLQTAGAVRSCSGTCGKVAQHSYWDSTLLPSPSDGGHGTGQTTTALQTPTSATGIYVQWDIDLDTTLTGTQDPWTFGTSRQYPALKYGLDAHAQQPKPGAPAAPTLVSGNTQLTATWTAPTDDGGNAINDYDVRYKLTTATTWTYTPDNSNNSSTTFSIAGLTNGSSYHVQVRAGNPDGDGPWSLSATGTAGAPNHPDLPTLGSGNQRLFVTWALPTNNGSAITGFKVQYRDFNASTWTDHTFTSDGTTRTTTITGLTNGTTYLVRVAATNARGTGAWSAANGLKPGAPEPPGAPTLTSQIKELRVDWSAPADNGDAIRRYHVHYRPAGGGAWKDSGHNNNSTAVLISELANGTEYEVRVRAANNRGNSRWSPVSKLKPGLPAKPATPSLATGGQRLFVTWEAPDGQGSDLTGFKIQYKLNSAQTWTEHTFTSTGSTLSATITGLTNNSNYDVQVAATNSHGTGPWSDAASGKAGGPDVPIPLVNASPNATSLAVSWAAPADNGSAISDYDLRYKTAAATTWTEPTATTSTLLTASLTGLTTGTVYEVQLRAANERGESPWSASARRTPGAPAAPAAPTLTAAQGQLTATWTAPANNGSTILDYDVIYRASAASGWSSGEATAQWQSAESSSTKVVVQGGAALDLGAPSSTDLGVTVSKETTPANVYKIGSAVARLRVKFDGNAVNTVGTNHVAVRYSTTKPADDANLYNAGKLLWDVDLSVASTELEAPFIGDGWSGYLPANSYFWLTTNNISQFWSSTTTIEVEALSTTLSRTISGLTTGTAHEVAVLALNARGYGAWSPTATATPSVDYDVDGDNLIEVSSLAQLNAMRWDLDGNGTASSGNESGYDTAFPDAASGMGCKATCTGYELRASLDFDTDGDGTADSEDTYWNSGSGWDPIGDGTTAYTGDFDGNGDADSTGDGGPYVIENLHVNRSFTSGTAYVGLFGVIGSGADVENVALLNASVTGSATGDAVYAGALAGKSSGTVTGSGSIGSVTAKRTGTGTDKKAYAGGLVGWNDGTLRASFSEAAVTASSHDANEGYAGGLAALNDTGDTIAASYAAGDVAANRGTDTTGTAANDSHAGGLVAVNKGTITASYATGDGTAVGLNTDMGGLVAENASGATITASYSLGAQTATTGTGGTGNKGGFAGSNAGTITDSYWDATKSGIADDADTNAPEGKTSAALKTPTTETGIYANWDVNVDGVTGNDDPWDFGNANQYPVLKFGALNASDQRHVVTLSADPNVIWERAVTTPARVNAATVTATLNRTLDSALTITLPTDAATYTLGSTTITIAAGATSGTTTLTAVNNKVSATDKAINLATGATASDAGVNITAANPTLTINDDDSLAKVTGVVVGSSPTAGGLLVGWAGVPSATGYVVEWKSGTQDWASTRRSAVGDVGIHDIAAASLGTGSHTVRVSATGAAEVDAGPPSDAKTVPAAPATAPSLVSGGSTLTATWTAPTGTATVNDYDLRHSRDSGATWTDVEMNAAANTALSHAIGSLNNGSRYQVQVRASSAGGDGPWSASATGLVGAPSAPDAPTLAPGNAQLTATWTAPANNGSAVTDYDLRHSSDSGATWTTVEMNAAANTARSFTVTTLTNGTTYQVQVRATNVRGDGAWSASASVTVGAPSAPAAPTVTPGNGSLVVTWTAATNNGSAITDYDLRRCNTGCNTATNWTEIEMDAAANTARSYTITTLTNSTTYQVQVRATNTHGDSEWSASSSGTPVAQAPSRIAKPSEAQEFLVWNAPANNGASITDYDVRYSIDGGTLWTEHRPDQTSTSRSLYKHFLPGQPSGTNYVIQVRAENSVGSSQWSPSSDTFSVAARAPEEPSPVTLDPGNTSMTVLWQAPQDNGSAITDYDVRYRQHGTHTWTEWDASTDSTATSVTVTGLTNNTSYHFQVRASNGQGDSSWSPFTPVFWRPGRPDRPVPSLVPGNRSLTASWSAVDGNGSAVNDYDVEYRVQGESSWTWHVHGGTGTSATISNLTNGTTYEVKVSATNSSGNSQDSDIVTATAGAPGRPAAPTLASTDGTLTATWTAPSTNGGSAINDYDVRYRYTVASTWEYLPDTTDSTALTATLSSLHNGAPYLVQVRAGNTRTSGGNSVNSDGQWSESAMMTPGLPAKPAAPTLTAGNRSLVVAWTAPSANGGTLSGFKVQYKLTSASTWSTHTFTSSGTTVTTTITGLTNDSAYNVQVAATNEHGDGPWSDSTNGTPTAQPPSKPAAPTLTAGNAQLTVSWTAPANNGASISDYDLQYSSDGSTWTFVEMDSAANTARSYVITTLTNGTAYQVQVRATNSKGDSLWSDSATGTPVGPPGAPAAPTLVSGNTKIDLSWAAPTDNGGSAITAYRVQYSTDQSTWLSSNVTVNFASRTASITGLANGTTYFVSVAARNAQGIGDDSPDVSIKAGLPARPNYAPELGSGDGRLTAKMFTVDGNGSPITDYDLRYRVNGTTAWTETTDTISAAWSQNVDGLTNGTTYDVQYRGGNTHGDGPWSFYATLTAGAPSAPIRPKVDERIWDLTLSWYQPHNSGSVITDYDVQYMTYFTIPKDENGNRSIPDDQDGVFGYDRLPWVDFEPDVVSTDRSVVIDDLLPGYAYWVRVRAVNARGNGAWSEFSSRSMYVPPALEMSKPCVKGGTTTLNLARSCRIVAGVGGIQTFDTATITSGAGVIVSDGRTNPNKAEFIAFKAEGGTATVKTYESGAERDTFNITVTPFSIGSASASDTSPAPGDTITVDVSLISPINHTFNENIIGLDFRKVEGKFARSWVKLELPAGWTGIDHGGTSINHPVQALGYNANSVRFSVTLPSNASGSPAITVKAYTRDLPSNCLSNNNCVQDTQNISNITVSSGVIGMSVVSPDPPEQVSPTLNATTNSLTANWSAPSSPAAAITGYEAQYRRLPNGIWTTWATPGASARSSTLTGLEAGAAYGVRMRARNAHGWGDYTDPPAGITLPHAVAPDGVGSVSAQRSGGNVNVTWTAPARATGYDVVYSTNNKHSWTRAATNQAATSYTIEGASAGLSYVVAVRAVNDAGESGWANSNLVPVSSPPNPPPDPTPNPQPDPPGGVGGLTASRAGNAVTASWNAAARATGYDVVYSTDDKASWTRAATNQAGTSYTLSGAESGKSYVFAVRAVNSAGASGWANSATVPAVANPPGSVSGVSAAHNGGSVSVTWDAANGATGYDVVYSTDGKASWTRAATNQSGTSYTLTGADAGKTYVFAVRAVNDAGASGWANSLPAKAQQSGSLAVISVLHAILWLAWRTRHKNPIPHPPA